MSELSKEDRVELACRLLESLEAPADSDWETAWVEELQKRVARIEKGEVQGIPVTEILVKGFIANPGIQPGTRCVYFDRSRGFVMHKHLTWMVLAGVLLLGVTALWQTGLLGMSETGDSKKNAKDTSKPAGPAPEGSVQATFGAGCFWCTEAVFQRLKGVHSVVSGYSGGSVKNPTYKQICTGTTGHAEVIQVTFDPKVISFPDLLEVFWKTHNPTTRNRQGNDVGTQYRSVIFYHSPEQKKLAEEYKQKLDAVKAFDAPIVTEITSFKEFFPAEAEHQNYYLDNPGKGYCAVVIRPKMEKFEKVFKDKLRSDK